MDQQNQAKKYILVAEDDKFLANAYRVKLEKENFDVRITKSGEETLAALKEKVPDLLILDLIMPDMDGFAVLGEINKDENLKKVPVVVASNLGQQEDVDKGINLGAIDYLIKSDLSLSSLVEKINKIVNK